MLEIFMFMQKMECKVRNLIDTVQLTVKN